MSELVGRLRRFSASEKELLAMTKDAADEIERLLAALKDARNCIFDCAADWPKASETALEKIDAALAFQQSTMGKSDAKG